MGDPNSRKTDSEPLHPQRPRPPEEFPLTIWMRIENVKDSTPGVSHAALTELCEAYWHPVYAFIRRKGNDPDRAADLTQGFFTLLIEPGALAAVTEGKGKFRSFLMAACTHFLSNQRVFEQALKRGGRRTPISMDQFQGEERLRLEPFHNLTPDRIFLREWARTLLDRVLSSLEAEAHRKGKDRLFDHIRPTLLGTKWSPTYSEIATALGVSESHIKVAVHRYRARYKQLLREEIARTVDDPADVEDEITALIQALAE